MIITLKMQISLLFICLLSFKIVTLRGCVLHSKILLSLRCVQCLYKNRAKAEPCYDLQKKVLHYYPIHE